MFTVSFVVCIFKLSFQLICIFSISMDLKYNVENVSCQMNHMQLIMSLDFESKSSKDNISLICEGYEYVIQSIPDFES